MVLDSQQSSDATESSAEDGGQQLRRVLGRVGVAQAQRGSQQGLAIRRLEELSGGVVKKESWRRYARGELPREETIPVIAAALEAAGADTTEDELRQALKADKAMRAAQVQSLRATKLKSGAAAADLMHDLIRHLSAAEQAKFFERMVPDLTPDQRLAVMRAIVAEPTKKGGGRGGNANNDGNAS